MLRKNSPSPLMNFFSFAICLSTVKVSAQFAAPELVLNKDSKLDLNSALLCPVYGLNLMRCSPPLWMSCLTICSKLRRCVLATQFVPPSDLQLEGLGVWYFAHVPQNHCEWNHLHPNHPKFATSNSLSPGALSTCWQGTFRVYMLLCLLSNGLLRL